MNKKILSIFALIMAISILGVSCAKDNNTTNPTPTPTTAPIDETEAEKVVQAIGTLTVTSGNSASFNFAQATVTASGANYTVSIADTAATGNVEIKNLISDIAGKKGDMEGAGNKLITVDDANISFVIAQDERTVAVTIPYSLKSDKNKKANFIITFDLNANHMFKLTEVAIATITGKFTDLGKVYDIASSGSDANNDNVDFASKSIKSGVMALEAKDKTNSGDNEIDLALITQVVAKINGITGLTGAKVTAEPPAANPTASTAAEITVTITLDNGYKFANDVTTAGVTVKDGVGTFKVTITPESSKTWAAAA